MRIKKELFIIFLLSFTLLFAQNKEEKEGVNSSLLSGFKFRSVGPALTSGRIIDVAIHPSNKFVWYVAAASGGVWKTTNAGTTFEPIFDNEGSYSIGCVTIDPNNPNIVWVGSGENNSQRSVSYGDGVYKSEDGGKSWKNMGLKSSEHIGKILIDKRNSNIVYVAAQGPLWNSGGERGLYKTTDGGKSWRQILKISDNTGVSDIAFDPENNDVVYAASYQRRRHVFTLINGGPETALYKSVDSGATFSKIMNGLPQGDVGRIGIAVAPSKNNIIYAVIEGNENKGGIFRSTDYGASWEKRNPYTPAGAQYYNELFVDPKNPDLLYSMDTYSRFSRDGGKTWANIPGKWRHVDDHAMWIDPDNSEHFMIGCDGGLYETWDNAENWNYKANLPVTQFYRVAVDNATPFYNIYGGTQDNFSLGGPSATRSASGIHNMDWFVTNGGDGFVSRIDPTDPNTVYAESQYGGLIRYNKLNGETVTIKPLELKDSLPYRWNWDSPLLISPHSNSRLYFCSNKVLKSDDKGNSWVEISPDLSRQINRNKLPVMGQVWGPDAIAKNGSTSLYGNIVSFSESPKQENLLFVGTDDGALSITSDCGKNWITKTDFPVVPDTTYISCITASSHNKDVLYISFDNHKRGDFKPYLLKSSDCGKTFTSIAGDLPNRETIYSIVEDFVNPDLLFVGTEFGIYFTYDGGTHWVQLKGGLPTIAVRDIAIQKDKCDLVLATFGRGFYVLDNYAPLRKINLTSIKEDAILFDVAPATLFARSTPLGMAGKGFLGSSLYTADNPVLGAVFNIYLKEGLTTQKELRLKAEKDALKKGSKSEYPSLNQLRAEDLEQAPYLIYSITDEQGNVIRKIKGTASKGINKTVWNLRYPTITPSIRPLPQTDFDIYSDVGNLVLPGKYFVSVSKVSNGVESKLIDKKSFSVIPLDNTITDLNQITEQHYKNIQELRKVSAGLQLVTEEIKNKLTALSNAYLITGKLNSEFKKQLEFISSNFEELSLQLFGNQSIRKRNEADKTSIFERVNYLAEDLWSTTSGPTKTQLYNYSIAKDEVNKAINAINTQILPKLSELEKQAEDAGAPYIPGRVLQPLK